MKYVRTRGAVNGHKRTVSFLRGLKTPELSESRGRRPGLPGLCGRKATLNVLSEHRGCVNIEVAVLGSSSVIVSTVSVSVDVKQH